MAAWDHLPNAVHIDRIVTSFRNNSEQWTGAWGACQLVEHHAAWNQVRRDLMSAGWNESRNKALSEDVAPVWGTAWDAILALVAYDDSAKYLDLPIDQLKMLYALTEHPACILLQTAVMVFAKEKEPA